MDGMTTPASAMSSAISYPTKRAAVTGSSRSDKAHSSKCGVQSDAPLKAESATITHHKAPHVDSLYAFQSREFVKEVELVTKRVGRSHGKVQSLVS